MYAPQPRKAPNKCPVLGLAPSAQTLQLGALLHLGSVGRAIDAQDALTQRAAALLQAGPSHQAEGETAGYARSYLGDLLQRTHDTTPAEPLLSRAIQRKGQLRLAFLDPGGIHTDQNKTRRFARSQDLDSRNTFIQKVSGENALAPQ